jgi:hypothetical protein
MPPEVLLILSRWCSTTNWNFGMICCTFFSEFCLAIRRSFHEGYVDACAVKLVRMSLRNSMVCMSTSSLHTINATYIFFHFCEGGKSFVEKVCYRFWDKVECLRHARASENWNGKIKFYLLRKFIWNDESKILKI